MKNLILILIFSIASAASGQDTSEENRIRIYEISFIQFPQTVELVEYADGSYSGNILTELTRERAGESMEITDKEPIEGELVKRLMLNLRKIGIESIRDCSEDEDCARIGFLDGGSLRFKIKAPNLQREYSFDEIHPLSEDIREKDDLRIQAQELVSSIYRHLDLRQRFTDLFKRLPKADYEYYLSSRNAIVTIENKKTE